MDHTTGPHCERCHSIEQRYKSLHLSQHTDYEPPTVTNSRESLASTKRMVAVAAIKWERRRGIVRGGLND